MALSVESKTARLFDCSNLVTIRPRLRFLPMAAISVVLSCLATSAWAETKSFDLSGFDGISTAQGVAFEIKIGEDFEVVAESADPKQLENLKLDLLSGVLGAEMEREFFSLNLFSLFVFDWGQQADVTIYVTMPKLTHVEAASGSWVQAELLSGVELELTASSGSKIHVDKVDGGELSLDSSSGASIKVASGNCSTQFADVSSGASLNTSDVDCAEVIITASSGSNASVRAEESIDADASSGARINVFGAHEQIDMNTSSGGAVNFK